MSAAQLHRLVHIDQAKAVERMEGETGGVVLPPRQSLVAVRAALGVLEGQGHAGMIGVHFARRLDQQIAHIARAQAGISRHQQRERAGSRRRRGGSAVHGAAVIAIRVQRGAAVQLIGGRTQRGVGAAVAPHQIGGHHRRAGGAVLAARGGQQHVGAHRGVGRAHAVGVQRRHHHVPVVAVVGGQVGVLNRQTVVAGLGQDISGFAVIVRAGLEADVGVARRLDEHRALAAVAAQADVLVRFVSHSQRHISVRIARNRADRRAAVALVEHAGAGGRLAGAVARRFAVRQHPTGGRLRLQPVETVQAGRRRHAAAAQIVEAHRGGNAGHGGAVAVGGQTGSRIVAIVRQVLGTGHHIARQVRVADLQAVVDDGHRHAAPLDAARMAERQVQIDASHAAALRERVLPCVLQEPLLGHQRISRLQGRCGLTGQGRQGQRNRAHRDMDTHCIS